MITARVSMLLKSRASLTCFRAYFLPGRAKELSAPRLHCDVSSLLPAKYGLRWPRQGLAIDLFPSVSPQTFAHISDFSLRATYPTHHTLFIHLRNICKEYSNESCHGAMFPSLLSHRRHRFIIMYIHSKIKLAQQI